MAPVQTYYTYLDPKYKFSLQIPSWWKNYIVVKRRSLPRNSDNIIYIVSFNFKYKGKVYIDAFSLVVFRMTLRKWREDGYDESPYSFLKSRNGLIFAGSVPGEPPDEFFEDEKKYRIPSRLLSRMVNDDVPKIEKSFKFV
ncbi:hypothetical protein GQF01_02010 [Paenibacillus sp. 5J-6]|uniref:Uncharacterized protein n=1 Tax=Paenibacillus silvestris TaxID=2606219 RepID=A0A6L8USL0_9BACL|nr:hypothetical protein [Paenibacillus silvestris]MZQ80914.1 hypothetical protein [Paenibacillus silvestris]